MNHVLESKNYCNSNTTTQNKKVMRTNKQRIVITVNTLDSLPLHKHSLYPNQPASSVENFSHYPNDHLAHIHSLR